MYTKFIYHIFLLPIILVSACAGTHHNVQAPSVGNLLNPSRLKVNSQKIAILKQDLAVLNDHVNLEEAGKLAEMSISYSLYLADEYRLVRPAIFHNILVRIGIKDRGLCYHWTEDLMEQLALLELKSFHLRWGVAYHDSEFREHNSVIVTSKGQDFSEGIVLDPWRNSGELHWSPVKDDRYPWKEWRPNE